MPLNSPSVGEFYNTLSDKSDQWVYVYKTKGPYVWLSGIHNTHTSTKLRASEMGRVVHDEHMGSNGLQLLDGNILGLSGKHRAEGVIFLEGDKDE